MQFSAWMKVIKREARNLECLGISETSEYAFPRLIFTWMPLASTKSLRIFIKMYRLSGDLRLDEPKKKFWLVLSQLIWVAGRDAANSKNPATWARGKLWGRDVRPKQKGPTRVFDSGGAICKKRK